MTKTAVKDVDVTFVVNLRGLNIENDCFYTVTSK